MASRYARLAWSLPVRRLAGLARLDPPPPGARLASLACVALLGAGCGSAFPWQLGLGSGTRFEVVQVVERGPYLDARLEGPFAMRTFARADDACRGVLVPGATVAYAERGISGRFEREGLACDAAGIGDPLLERARQPRATTLRSDPVPRDQASYSVLHEDETLALLHGYFPLAYLVRWPGGYDTVAAVPKGPACRRPIEAGVASMEYRDTGRPTLALVGEEGLCPIVGLLRPPRAGAEAED